MLMNVRARVIHAAISATTSSEDSVALVHMDIFLTPITIPVMVKQQQWQSLGIKYTFTEHIIRCSLLFSWGAEKHAQNIEPSL